MADIFISYTASDRDWAFWIARELEALGHQPHIHEWEVRGGDDIYAWMQARHDAADQVLCVVSDAYLKAPYSTLERNAAIWQAAGQRPGFVLFVAVKPCRFPTLIDHFRRCELYSAVSDEERRARLREFLSKKGAPDRIVLPVFAVSNIPVRMPEHFLGRDDALEAIDKALSRYEGRVAITALHGMRGVGKTTLAAVYAERHRGDYRATWWIRAQADSTMRSDLVALGIRLGWVGADDKEDEAVAAVMERLRHEGEGILLIYDNAIEARAIEPYLPRGGGAKVLVTSNAPSWRGVAEPVEIRLWPKTIGGEYLIARTGRAGERAAAEALSEALGGLPLAHEQAAAYCERLHVSLAEYARRFAAAPTRLLDEARYAPAAYHDGLTVAKTFTLAIAEAAKLHPAAEPLIVHAALLAPEPVPLFLFSDAREKFGEPLASALAGDGLDEAVAALHDFALLDREAVPYDRDPAITTDAIRLHRLVREVAAARCDGAPREAAHHGLLATVVQVYPDGYNNPDLWPRCALLTPHALAICEIEFADQEASAQCAALLNAAGGYLQGRAAYSSARSLYERALAIREKVFGFEHPDTATSLNNLALLLQEQGELATARPLYERALAVTESLLGPEHPDTATSLNNLGLILWDQGELAAARPFYQRALAIWEKVLGPEDPETAKGLNNLALLLQDQGDLAGARPLYERALAIIEKALGSEHPTTAVCLNNLARVLQAQGDLAGARPMFERALAIQEKVAGPENPDTATSLNNLGHLLMAQGDLGGARLLIERALSIREKALGPEQSDTANSLSSLAGVLQAQGNFVGALPLFERSVTIYQKALGAEHPTTNRVRRAFARLLLAMDEPSKALALGEISLAAHDKFLGPSHQWTKDSARVTAEALDTLDRKDEAAALRARYGIGGATA